MLRYLRSHCFSLSLAHLLLFTCFGTFFSVALFCAPSFPAQNGRRRVPLRWKLEMHSFWLLSRCADHFFRSSCFLWSLPRLMYAPMSPLAIRTLGAT
jgi:hypothetical protein